jgi:hypothetical protein
MKRDTAHCEQLGKPVQLVLARDAGEGESDVVCLDYGPHCSGASCPIGKTSPSVMKERLDRARPAQNETG